MTKLLTVKFTKNFHDNLEAIQAFLSEANAVSAYNLLLNELLEKVIPNLERFPALGRNFLQYPIKSVEVEQAAKALDTKLAAKELREYLMVDYLILYTHQDDAIYLLSIKHHRQLSFNFDHIWQA